MHILIVEDQAGSRSVLRCILERENLPITVHDFESPEDALRWCRSHVADVIVADYRLPVMNGLEFIEQVRELPGHRLSPILMITSEESPKLRDIAAAIGVIEVIRKPVSPRAFRDRMLNLLTIRKSQFVGPGGLATPRHLDESVQFTALGKRMAEAVTVAPAGTDESGQFRDLGRQLVAEVRKLRDE